MDGNLRGDNWAFSRITPSHRGEPKRWRSHEAHLTIPPHFGIPWSRSRTQEQRGVARTVADSSRGSKELVILDGSHGEGGGQILRTALTLSLLSGRPFQMTRIRANREKPGLRPQHCSAVQAAALLGHARTSGVTVGSHELVFRPEPYSPRDLVIDIGTAGSTSLVLQTLHLPLAMRSETAVRVVLTGGTFNPKAPPYPFLERTWRAYLAALGMSVALAMPAAGFYPRGGGQLDAWIEPATPRAWIRTDRGPLQRIYGVAGVSNLRDDIARRLRDRAIQGLDDEGLAAGLEIEIETVRWAGPGQGAAIALFVEHENAIPATFVGLGERGRPAEAVADSAVEELLSFEACALGAVDPHSADQILVPLALAEGRSIYSVSAVTDHLRTNAATIRAFLDRPIVIDEPIVDGQPGRVVVG